eukprot:2481762-Ditylum_brightwellii.AAC.1
MSADTKFTADFGCLFSTFFASNLRLSELLAQSFLPVPLVDTTIVTLVTLKLNPNPSLARAKPTGMLWACILGHPEVLPAGGEEGAGADSEAVGAGALIP